jgi:hypothetical protein
MSLSCKSYTKKRHVFSRISWVRLTGANLGKWRAVQILILLTLFFQTLAWRVVYAVFLFRLECT